MPTLIDEPVEPVESIVVPFHEVVTAVGDDAQTPYNCWFAGKFWRHRPTPLEAALYYLYVKHGIVDGKQIIVLCPDIATKLHLQLRAVFGPLHFREACADFGHVPRREDLVLHFIDKHANEFGELFVWRA